MVFVTHSIAEAVLLADRILILAPRPDRVQDVLSYALARPRTLASMDDPAFNDLASASAAS